MRPAGEPTVRMRLPRSIASAALGILMAAVAALLLAALGRRADLAVVAVAVATSILAVVLFRGLAGMMRERHALERRLARAERLAAAGELAASVAHEIKNPLAPIKGYAQLLEARLAEVTDLERPMFEKGLRIIREEADRIDRRVAVLLDVARADRTRTTNDERFELNRVVLEAAAVAEGEPSLMRLSRKLDPGIGAVVGNEDEIRGALVNLMKNAVEAKPGVTLDVLTRCDGDRAIVEIADDGPGIPPEIKEQVFQIFYTTKANGTGLGLAIARSAVEAAGGTIELVPREGGGTIARIALAREVRS